MGGGNKHGQKHFMKMFNQGKKFLCKFMKAAAKNEKKCAKKEAKKAKKEEKSQKKSCGMPFSWDQFAGKCQENGKSPFSAMCEMWKNAKKSKCQAKKAEIKKPVEAMTYEEQTAHAMKLSQENVKKVAEKKVEAKKVEKVEETMTPKVDECDVKKPEDVNEV